MVCVFIFDGVVVKTENKMINSFWLFCLPMQVAQNMSGITGIRLGFCTKDACNLLEFNNLQIIIHYYISTLFIDPFISIFTLVYPCNPAPR